MADSSQYNLSLVIKAQNQATAEFEKLNSQVSWIWKTIWWLAISKTLVDWMKSVASEALTLWWNLEQAEVAFSTMLWSWEEANKMLKDLTEFAKKTPFELTWIRESARQMMAMWIESDKVLPTLKSLWDVSAWLWVDLSRLAYNFWQVKSQWHLTWTELRDFTKMWIPLVNELAKSLWKSETEIQKMVSAWEIWFDVVEQAFKDMTSEWWKFENLMEKQSWTYQWMMSNLQDSIDSIKETIWRTFIPILEKVLDKINPIIEKVSERIENNPELATTIATVVAGAIALIWALSWLSAILPLISSWMTLLLWPIWRITAWVVLLATARINNRWWIQEKTQAVVDRIAEIIQPRLDKLSARRDKRWWVVIEVVKWVRSLVQDIFVSAFEVIWAWLEIFFQWIDVLLNIFSWNREEARDWICKIRTTLRDTTLSVVDNLFWDALDRIADKLVSFWDRFNQKRNAIKNRVLWIANAMREWLKTWFEFRVAVFTWDRETASNILTNIASWLDEALTWIFWTMRTNVKNTFQSWIDRIVDKMNAFKDTVMSIVNSIKEAWNSAKNFVWDVWSWISNAASSARDFVSSPFKAWWWDVYWWQSYIVWEKWPELFVPKQSWTITPTNQITNNNWIEININWAVVRNDNDIQAIADEIIRQVKLEKNFWIA